MVIVPDIEGAHLDIVREVNDAVADAISMLDEPEMKQVRDNITASICADDN